MVPSPTICFHIGKMKIIVTGGTGFLGKIVVNVLNSADNNVISCSKEKEIDMRNYDQCKIS